VGRFLKWSWAFNGVVGTAALFLPLSAAPESHTQAQTTKTATDTASSAAPSTAAAHVDFKIIVPRVLSLSVADVDTAAAATGPVATVRFNTVAVASNSRNVAITATVGSPSVSVAGNVILSAAAGKTIAQNAVCAAPGYAGGISGPADRIICTASMP
jgi:hypothetical protein